MGPGANLCTHSDAANPVQRIGGGFIFAIQTATRRSDLPVGLHRALKQQNFAR